jgi:hypothetical protein
MAQLFKVKAFLSDPVERELEANWMRDFDKTERDAIGKASNLSRLLGKVGSTAELQVPPRDEVLALYRAKVEEAIKLGFERAPITGRSAAEVFELAVGRQQPFSEKGTGFQDAVICLSAIDHLAQSADKTGAFVSRDRGFDQQGIDRLAGTQGVQLILYADLESIGKVLGEELDNALKKFWDADRQRDIESAQNNMELLQSFIRASLEIPERLDGLEIVRVTNIEAVEVLEARTPFPLDRKEGEPITVSVDVKIRLHVVARGKRPELLWGGPRKLKMGEEPPTPYSFAFSVLAGWPAPEERILDRTVELELKAKVVGENYNELEPLSVKLKTPPTRHLGLFGPEM